MLRRSLQIRTTTHRRKASSTRPANTRRIDLFAGPGSGCGRLRFVRSPHVATLVLNYKHDKWAVTPALQWSAGTHYGYPIATLGVDPSACGGTHWPGTVAGDPRYPYGGTGAPLTSRLAGQRRNPVDSDSESRNRQVRRRRSSVRYPHRVTLASQSQLHDESEGHRSTDPLEHHRQVLRRDGRLWTNVPGVSSSKVCGYDGGYSGVGIHPIGNNYNPGVPVQPFQGQSYYPGISTLPFNAYLDFKIKF